MNCEMELSPTISLVMIVRDEAHNIKQLLQDMAPVFDEAVVVDTGSTDDTVALAQAAGAKVVHFHWCDDFASARNFGIAAADCHWILTMDADERMADQDFSILKQAVASGVPKGYLFTQRNYTDLFSHPEWRSVDGKYPKQESGMHGFIEAHQIRLFPNLPELRYQGCIHETIGGCTRSAVEKEYLQVTIHHFGHLQTGDAAKRRTDLYSRLTREKFRQNPQDSDACFQMATRYMEEGRIDQAQKLLEQLVVEGKADHPATTRGNLALGRILQQKGEPSDAIKIFELAVQQKPEWLTCWTQVISALVETGRWGEVSRYLTAAKAIFQDDPLLWRFECRLLVATGEYRVAAEKAEKLIVLYPDWQGAHSLASICRKLAQKYS